MAWTSWIKLVKKYEHSKALRYLPKEKKVYFLQHQVRLPDMEFVIKRSSKRIKLQVRKKWNDMSEHFLFTMEFDCQNFYVGDRLKLKEY
jgi:hypothetical protein